MIDLLFGNLPNRVLHDLAQVARIRLGHEALSEPLSPSDQRSMAEWNMNFLKDTHSVDELISLGDLQ